MGAARPLHSAGSTRLAETQALSQHAPGTLMARAGLAVAQMTMSIAPHARVVHVFAGPGNNGGDGLVAARHLQAAGRQVQVHQPVQRARACGRHPFGLAP